MCKVTVWYERHVKRILNVFIQGASIEVQLQLNFDFKDTLCLTNDEKNNLVDSKHMT